MLPTPPSLTPSREDDALDKLELLISLADIYLWLSQRSQFKAYAPDAEEVRLMRSVWSDAIDTVLVTHLDEELIDIDAVQADGAMPGPRPGRRRSRGRGRSRRTARS